MGIGRDSNGLLACRTRRLVTTAVGRTEPSGLQVGVAGAEEFALTGRVLPHQPPQAFLKAFGVLVSGCAAQRGNMPWQLLSPFKAQTVELAQSN